MGKALTRDLLEALARVRDRTASERDLQKIVMRYARDHGWRAKHDLPARVSDGRVLTAFQGDGGFPDCIMVRPPRLVIIELKNQKGTTSPAQDIWLRLLEGVPGIEVYVWRPSDWADVKRTLI